MAEIRLRSLRKSFDGFTAVRNTNLTIGDGQFVVLLGPSGCGKTTTLRMIAGLELPTSGQIFVGDEDMTWRRARERDIAFVFQLFALYPHMTVRQNIAFPLKNEGRTRREVDERVMNVAKLLRIEELMDRRTGGLSGGDRQRVALGRAIVREPKAFLMDEPLGTLDADFRELMCLELRKLHDRLHATTVYVTHDQSEAMAMADEIVVMNSGDVLQCGAPDKVYHYPQTVFVGSFIGSPPMNFLPIEEAVLPGACQVRVATVEIPVGRMLEGSEQALLGIRPEHITLDDTSLLRGQAIAEEYLGSHQIVIVETAAGLVRVRTSKGISVATGSTVGLRFQVSRTLLYDRASGQLLASASTEFQHGEHAHG